MDAKLKQYIFMTGFMKTMSIVCTESLVCTLTSWLKKALEDHSKWLF